MASIPPTALHQPLPLRRRISDDEDEEEEEEKGNKPMLVYSSIESLPTELLFEILARLPADFLHEKARLVCPKWNKIIHTRAFINSHQLRHSSYGLVLSSMLVGCASIYVTATQGRIEASELGYKLESGTKYMTSCCCKGLAVLVHGSTTLHVVNPASKQSLPLPPVPPFPDEIRLPFRIYAGIAYSAASMEYKLILPYVVCCNDFQPRIGLEILTVGVDNSWRHVSVDHLEEDVRGLLSMSPLTTEGFFHWGSVGRHFLTMNVETEIFTYSEAPLPSPPPPKYRNSYHLSTGRYLTVLVSCGNYLWQVWEMKPETGEWRKPVHDIELEDQTERLRSFSKGQDDVLIPLGWVKYPEVLAFYFKGDSCTCIFYNLDTREISTVKLPESCNDYRAFPHRHSLVWLS